MAAPCARLQLVRGPVRSGGCGRPFNGIVSHQFQVRTTYRPGAVVVLVACLSCVSCETPSHIGKWAYEDATSYAGFSLEAGGRCTVIGVEKKGVAIGCGCSYILESDVVVITEYWDRTTRWNADPPVRLKYDAGRDVLLGGKALEIELHRVPKLLGIDG